MLYIIIEKQGIKEQITWCIGETNTITSEQIRQVIEVKASRNELEYIKDSYFLGKSYSIPMHNFSPIQVWFGDIAKTIVANL